MRPAKEFHKHSLPRGLPVLYVLYAHRVVFASRFPQRSLARTQTPPLPRRHTAQPTLLSLVSSDVECTHDHVDDDYTSDFSRHDS